MQFGDIIYVDFIVKLGIKGFIRSKEVLCRRITDCL